LRLTNQRYSRDLRPLQLALRMLKFEARTGTIRRWTGLTETRIRALGKSDYAVSAGAPPVRHRGPAPYRIESILADARLRADANAVAAIASLLTPIAVTSNESLNEEKLAMGESLCCLYETYSAIVPLRRLSFEQVVLILESIAKGECVTTVRCSSCEALLIQDALRVAVRTCRQCAKAPRALLSCVLETPAKVAEEPSGYQHKLF
jgi:hypothetical protein